MEGLSASQGIKKQPLIPHMGQELHSCDTTQIGVVKHPLASRAITRARWITGGYPSASTWSPVQAALGSPFTRPRPTLIPPSRALLRFAAPATTLPHRFILFGCWAYYSRPAVLCQVFSREILHRTKSLNLLRTHRIQAAQMRRLYQIMRYTVSVGMASRKA